MERSRHPANRGRIALLTAAGLVAILAFTGCSDRREKAIARMRAVGPERLRRDAALLYKDLFASGTLAFMVLKTDRCPESFRAIGPTSVGAYTDGFSLSIKYDGGTETGIYIVPSQMDLQPASRGRAHFEPLDDGIYWYTFRP